MGSSSWKTVDCSSRSYCQLFSSTIIENQRVGDIQLPLVVVMKGARWEIIKDWSMGVKVLQFSPS